MASWHRSVCMQEREDREDACLCILHLCMFLNLSFKFILFLFVIYSFSILCDLCCLFCFILLCVYCFILSYVIYVILFYSILADFSSSFTLPSAAVAAWKLM